MRKLVIVAIMLSVLVWPSTLAFKDHGATQLTLTQMAGDVGPNGG